MELENSKKEIEYEVEKAEELIVHVTGGMTAFLNNESRVINMDYH